MRNYVQPPVRLLSKIMDRLAGEKRLLSIRRHLIIFSFSLVGSAAALAPTFKMAQAGLAESGFFTFFSLLFLDLEIITSHWQNFAWMLLESLPAASLAIFLAAVFVFLGSLKILSRDIKSAFLARA